jgi:hypothetical protein
MGHRKACPFVPEPSAPFTGNDRFEVVRVLGEGAMGLVYEAVDRETGDRVALKRLRLMSPDFLARFKSEFREFQSVSHRNLVSLGELHEHRGVWFFTMELVEGTSFVEWVRGLETTLGSDEPTLIAAVDRPAPVAFVSGRLPGRLVESRLRAAVAELAIGLETLHSTAKVHRDLKPQNVRVARDGRVVIIDFGLAIDLMHSMRSVEPELVGTIAYMSPEQAARRPVTPASDWYSVGVMLFEAVVGELPFTGAPHAVLTAKQTQTAPKVLSKAPDCPPEIAHLIDGLLHHVPSQRPSAAHVRAVVELGVTKLDSTSSGSPSHGGAFIGREHEAARLVGLSRQVQTDGTKVAVVVGESGLGKTALLREVVRRIHHEDPFVWVIDGACYEREATPYKGLDAAIDVLAELLERLPHDQLEDLVPKSAGMLTQAFPVLSRVPHLAEVAPRSPSEEDPLLLRAGLFRNLRELVSRVADRRLLVLVLDDLQWAGADTFSALEALLKPPDPPRLLVLLTLRAEPSEHDEWRARLAQQLGDLSWLPLPPLSRDEATQLAHQVAQRLGYDPERLRIAEGGGNPLFIDTLVRLGPDQTGMSLDAALFQRTRELSDEARRVLNVVALSNGQLPQEVVCRSAELDFATFSRQVGALRVARLVQSGGQRSSDFIRVHHDRVRTAVRTHLPDSEQQQVHRSTALAIEALPASRNDEALAWHWQHAREPARAARASEAAGDAAVRRLAFDRAAALYNAALDLARHPEPELARLNSKLGDALTHAGRGAQAAAAFQAAAALAPPMTALELRRRAADQLLRSGRVREGLNAIEEVLAIVDKRTPQTPSWALARLLWSRARLALRGTSFKPRQLEAITPLQLMRVDATYSVAQSLSTVDLIKSAEMQSRSLLLALQLGEPQRVARGLFYEAALASTGGSAAQAAALEVWKRAEALAEGVNEPNLHGLKVLTRGVIAFQNAQWRQASDAFERARDHFIRAGTAAHWELTNSRIFLLSSWFYLGRYDRWLPEVPRLLEECAQRGDVYASTNLRMTHFCGFWLAQDSSHDALSQVDAAMAEWAPLGYLSQHYYALVARVSSLVYAGEAETAMTLLEREWPNFQRSLHPRVQFVRIEAQHLKGRVALAVGRRAVAEKSIKALEKERTPFATRMASLLKAPLLWQQGSKAAAIELMSATAKTCVDEDLGSYVRPAAWRAASWREDGDEVRRLEAELRSFNFVRPERYLALYAPALPAP